METPIACPICWDHQIQPVDGVRLAATINCTERQIANVSAYRCGNWHVFVVLSQPGLDEETGLGRDRLARGRWRVR